MITHRLCQALRLAFVAASSFAALAHAADPSTVAWIQEDPDASELVATKEGWSKCLSGCVLIPAKGDIENEVKLEELRAIAARDGIPLADSWWSTIHLGAWSPLPAAHAADAPPLVLSAAELAGKLQKRNAYPYLGFTPVPHWYAGSTTPDRLWQLRRSVHRESFFRLGNRLPARSRSTATARSSRAIRSRETISGPKTSSRRRRGFLPHGYRRHLILRVAFSAVRARTSGKARRLSVPWRNSVRTHGGYMRPPTS